MSLLSEAQIEKVLQPYLSPISPELTLQLSAYLGLLTKWNARTNLTAVRDPEEMVRRHFGESLFTGRHLGDPLPDTLLDLGSGAGFPGIPIALLHPSIAVTLAESQNKKATFLREVVRTLGLKNIEVWGGRAEDLPADRTFHTVTLRAVDHMAAALDAAVSRAAQQILLLATGASEILGGLSLQEKIPLPESHGSFLLRFGVASVPRGTL
ncbi:16S rRNA (guanine(527)-N(7))-methyltransferase RsmG [Edaphobacter sp. 12200R-103]|jgi:16S rRNA (guanine527-N7)-methyltransferase|uniref:16S rRNA (guanine(527)-N(7))-methyltransferase RsmG n=1 Tax=Edaphobacter sp. 12200R-103 TaxID=2703788 RepID=UPI00138C88AA|nr:16S rRNA (guanine(527)-N(7))-methyltransferase RsmG [Edaphobacter sp. 12200R-103]QHS52684.1 16S rRNA (guanine(527)-N(7))-methyltransferase RsmG [Edaphobacter sp. 12200R-103]